MQNSKPKHETSSIRLKMPIKAVTIQNMNQSQSSLLFEMDLKHKQVAFKNLCDSGYNSLDLDEIGSQTDEDKDSPEGNIVKEEENEESFSDWLKKVAKCLGSRTNTEYYKNKAEKEEEEDEAARCMRIVRSVLDEKTVLEMTKDYLHYAKVTSVLNISHIISAMIILRTQPFQTTLQ